jgi:hypothetical protein
MGYRNICSNSAGLADCSFSHKNENALVKFKYRKERDARIAKALGLEG